MRLFVLSLLAPTLLWVAAVAAEARGGRYRAPAGAPSARSAATPDVPSASDHPAGVSPSDCPQPSVPAWSAETPDKAGETAVGRRAARSGPKRLGLADWSYWYDANREEFEDLRRAALLTEANPLFALGGAHGERIGRPRRRLDDASVRTLKTSVRAVLAGGHDHWVYTQGAAYVALGKIATEAAEVELLLAPLRDEAGFPRYVRESAALGLGQLRRTDARRRLAGTTLDPARRALEAVLAKGGEDPRLRAFAAVSLGLLADQPSADAAAGRRSADALTRLWTTSDLPDETQVGLLVGLGLHPPAEVGSLTRLALQACALRAKLGSRGCSGLVRAHAALALARLGGPDAAPALVELLAARRDAAPVVQQAAAVAAGVLGRRCPATRVVLGEALLRARSVAKDPGGRHLATIALGRLLAADVADGRAVLLDATKVRAHLLGAVYAGAGAERAFAALAAALAVRDVDDTVEVDAQQALRAAVVDALRAGLADASRDGHTRAAFATALGLARDERSPGLLLPVLRDEDQDPALRAYAALALGLVGSARVDVVRAVADALRDTRSDELRLRATTALGLLGGGKKKDLERTIAILVDQLRATRNQHVKGQIAITLARIGDARAVEPLVAMLRGTAEPHLNRSLACAALGLLGDEERTPVLSATRRDSHYMSGSSVVFDLLDVL